ncbi:MAG: hypothetical protein P4L45_15410, partial [Ignavibacteriaceae bacterium]|nr:hypothetical protein [Ignavibacteriaceae bacterium]
PGMPEQLDKLNFEDEDINSFVLMASPFRGYIEGAKDNLDKIIPLINNIKRDGQGQNLLKGRDPAFFTNYELIKDLLGLIEKNNPLKKILNFNEDILGVYQYVLPRKDPYLPELFPEDPHSGKIILYWGVIGLVAAILGVEIEHLTAVVLAHELAHAYTHIGMDINRSRWNSLGFSKSDIDLKEGLAQYYAFQILQKIETQYNSVRTFSLLLKDQPAPYHKHIEFQNFSPEEIRLALIRIRNDNNGIGKFNTFKDYLEEARKLLNS